MKKSQSGKSVDSQFGYELGASADWAVLNGLFYHWVGSHWQLQEFADMKRLAYEWLKKHFPDEAKATRAEQLVNAAMLDCRSLPQVCKRNIVPTGSCYFEILSGGAIQALNPDRQLGMTYVVNADIGCHQGTYVPPDLPSDSLFSRFLKSSLPSPDVVSIVQEFAGYSLLTTTKFQVGQLWFGSGRNGKSVLLEIVRALHAKTADMKLEALHGFALQPLFGATLACVSEAPRTGVHGEMLKAMIAGDSITIDRKYLEPVSYKPTAKWLMAANNIIRSADHSDGWWRRFHIIPWSVQIPESELIPDLAEQICEFELHLVLNWALQGVSRLLARGRFDTSSKVLTNAKQQFIANSNPVVAWLSEIEPVAHQVGMSKDEVFKEFCKWCDANNHRCPASNTFWENMHQQLKGSFQMDKRHQVRVSGKSVDFVRFAFGDALRNLEAPWDDDETPETQFVQPKAKPFQQGARF